MTTTTSSTSIDLSPGTIHYRDLGAGEPLVFVHGLLVDGQLWQGVAERLAPAHRCLVADWPMGSHRTAMNPDADLSPRGQAALIAEFIERLELGRVTLIGNDSGGAVSQMLTAERPELVERLVLTNCDTFENFPPFPFNAMPAIARLPGGMTALSAPFRIRAIGRAAFRPLVKRPIDAGLVDGWLAPSQADKGVRNDARKLIAGMRKRELVEAAERLRGFERPLRIAWAPEDGLFKYDDAKRLASMVADSRIAEVAGAGAFSPLDQPARVAELIAEFVAEPAGATV